MLKYKKESDKSWKSRKRQNESNIKTFQERIKREQNTITRSEKDLKKYKKIIEVYETTGYISNPYMPGIAQREIRKAHRRNRV